MQKGMAGVGEVVAQLQAASPDPSRVGHYYLQISNRRPWASIREVEKDHAGALASQWIPMDGRLWSIESYAAFLEARRALLAEAANAFFTELLHGDDSLLCPAEPAPAPATAPTIGGIESAEEELQLQEANAWVEAQGLPAGIFLHELADPETGDAVAILNLAWPEGLQAGLSEPVALLVDEGPELLACANRLGFSCFTDVAAFQRYAAREVVAEEGEGRRMIPERQPDEFLALTERAATTFSEVRDRIIAMLRRDLIGPLPPTIDGDPDADLQREWLSEPPAGWYLAGFIGPIGEALRQDGVVDDPDAAEERETAGGNMLDREAEPREDDDTGAVAQDDETPEAPVVKRRFVPASIGVTVMLPDEVEAIDVRVTWGDYTTEPPLSPEQIAEGIEEELPKLEWLRQPREALVHLPVPEPGERGESAVPASAAPLMPGGGLVLLAGACPAL